MARTNPQYHGEQLGY
jgi:small GTP-binding protein